MGSKNRSGSRASETVPAWRSELMGRIRGANTTPEVLLRRALTQRRLRYRLHPRLSGCRPDLAFPGKLVAIFIDGCFWHGCPKHYVRPRGRAEFWASKLVENTERDRRQTLALEQDGWVVLRLWEHEVFESLDRVADHVARVVLTQRIRRRPAWRVVRIDLLDETGSYERRWMEDLRDPAIAMAIDQARTTKKWKRRLP